MICTDMMKVDNAMSAEGQKSLKQIDQVKIEEKAKIRRRTNPEEANIRKRQKYGGVKNQEEAIGKSGGGKK